MFCRKCGTKLSPNATFCGVCGEKVTTNANNTANQQQAPQQNAKQAPRQTQQVPNQAPQQNAQQAPRQAQQTPNQAPQQNSYVPPVNNFFPGLGTNQNSANTQMPENENPNASEPKETEEKEGGVKIPKKFLILGTSIVAVVALVLSFMFVPALRRFWENNIYRPIAGSLVKTFASDEDYFQFVEKQAFDSYGGYINAATNVYGTIMDTTARDTYVDASLAFRVSDKAYEFLEEATGSDIDFGFINEAKFEISGGQKGDLVKMDTAIKINGQTLFDPSVLVDMDKEEIFISILSLSDKYLKTEADGISEFAADGDYSIFQSKELRKALPDDDELDAFVTKYLNIALGELTQVSVGEEELEIGDIEQKLTAVEVEFTEEIGMNMIKAILEEAKKDKKIKGYINDLAKLIEEEDLYDELDAEDVYEDFVDGIDDLLDELEDADPSDDVLFILIDYVDSTHKIVGRALVVGDDSDADPVAFYATVHNKKNYAFELSVPMAGISVTGEGVDRGGVLTGEYVVTANGQDVIEIAVEKFNTNIIGEGKIKGKFTFAPSKDLIKSMGLNGIEYEGISVADLALMLDLDVAPKKADITVGLLVDEEEFVGATLAYKIGGAPKFKTPSDKKVIDIDDAEDYLESINLDKFIKKLKKAKLPEEIIESVEDFADDFEDNIEDIDLGSVIGGMSGMSGIVEPEDYYNDYYDDYYDDYYETEDYYDYYY